jgi:amino acid transporter
MPNSNLGKKLKTVVLGGARDPHDKKIFHTLSLIAFLAWVGLGSDGLSSSCYGPEEAFRTLGGHVYLGIFVALGTAITIFIISSSYSQIIELFPTGGGGYLVASKLLSPKVGMVSGCALIIDYVLTITISVASGAAAIFSFLPPWMVVFKLPFALFGLIVLLVLNLRGIKEAVVPLVPVFMTFVILHAFAIIYTIVTHTADAHHAVQATGKELSNSVGQLGILGTVLLIMKSYSMGAGTFTGIEAVSNGIPILRDPKVKTAHKTMRYMSISLAVTVMGLMIAYLFYGVHPSENKTLNAVLFETMTAKWNPSTAQIFMYVILMSEAILLFIAAQTGFLDGPRVLSNMALDRWFPTRFANLSDRLVTKNGIILMGLASICMMLISKGSIAFLAVLYSINVFITFSLSQLGMVRHWWTKRGEEKHWEKKLAINALGLVLTTFILISVVIIKFGEGGWLTIVITGSMVFLALRIKKHYEKTMDLLKRLDVLIDSVTASIYNIDEADKNPAPLAPDLKAKTAVIMVNGFNGLGIHTLLSVFRMFSGVFKNFVFIQVGSVDAGSFKGAEEVENLKNHIAEEADKYVDFLKSAGYYAEAYTSTGIDLVDEISKNAELVLKKYDQVMFFGGQLVFPEDTYMTQWLHNYIVFAIQRKFYMQGYPFIILPIRV